MASARVDWNSKRMIWQLITKKHEIDQKIEKFLREDDKDMFCYQSERTIRRTKNLSTCYIEQEIWK